MKRLIYIFFFVLFANHLFAQSFADSIIRIHSSLPLKEKLEKYLKVAGEIQNKDHVNCTKLCDEIIHLSKALNGSTLEAEAYLLKGLSNYFAGEYQLSLQYYLMAIKKFELIGDMKGKAKVLNELGFFYRKQQQDSLSTASFKEAFRLAREIGDKNIMGTAINNQGISAQDKGAHATALVFFDEAQRLYKEVKDSIGISYTMDYSAVSHAFLGNYQLATLLEQDAYQLRLHLRDSNAAALSLFSLSEFEKMQRHFSEAEKYLFNCLSITEKIKYKDLSADCYLKLSEIYGKSGQAQRAYEYHVKYSILNEEIFNEKRSKQINELQTKYETEKRLHQIELLQRANELKEIKNRNQRFILLGILAFILAMVATAYHYLKRKKQRELDAAIIHEKELGNKAMIEAEEKERIRIARDLHDGVAQMMTAAKMQLESFLSKNQEGVKKDASLIQAFELMKEAAIEVRSVSHSMIPNALIKSGLMTALADFVVKMETEKTQIELIGHGLEERLDVQLEAVVFRVLQELVNNIFKHANATHIIIQIIKSDTELNIMVEDNGVGFDVTQFNEASSGIGLRNIYSRIAYLNGHIMFDSNQQHGTTVMIDIPL